MSIVKERVILFQLVFIFAIICTIFVLFHSMTNVTGQEEQNTTVNITIRGNFDKLIVDYFPVNFTIDPGLAPGIDNYPKQGTPYLKVSAGPTTNVRWNVSINASDMTDGLGHFIPVEEINVNYSCNTDDSTFDFPDLSKLSSSLYNFCMDTVLGKTGLAYDGYALIYFFLDVPKGQYNSTYYGDIWIDAISLEAQIGYNNNTWYGPGNTTATIKKLIEIKWTLTPISFGTVNPGYKVNATKNQGWPTNITIGSATNVPVDLYVNGTDLIGSSMNIDSHNITYSNATSETDWPFPHVHLLNNTLPDDSTGGDFSNWGSIQNNTDVFSFWEMDVPNVPGGDYLGSLIAKAVDAGNDPTI